MDHLDPGDPVVGQPVLMDQVLAAVGEGVDAVVVLLRHVLPDDVLRAGGEDGDPVLAVVARDVPRDQVLVGVGEVYAVPTLATEAVVVRDVVLDPVVVGEDEADTPLDTAGDGVVGDGAVLGVGEVDPVKPALDGEPRDRHLVRLDPDPYIPLSSADPRVVADQSDALCYLHPAVGPRRHHDGVSDPRPVDRRLNIA